MTFVVHFQGNLRFFLDRGSVFLYLEMDERMEVQGEEKQNGTDENAEEQEYS